MDKKEQSIKLNQELGHRVKFLRENLALSRKDLAECLDISEYFLVEIESGRKGVSNVTLCKLSKALCTSVDFLLTGRESLSDVTAVTSMLTKIDPPLVKGAEDLLRTYLSSINYVRSQLEKENTND